MSIFDKDWFERNNNYVIKDAEQSVGWDNNITDEYSRWLYNDYYCEAMLSDNLMLIKELNDIIVQLNLKETTKIYINSKEKTAYTDGENIVLSKAMIPDNISDFNKLDILLGAFLHECSHCLYTDFNNVICGNTNEELLKHEIQNIIEDEIIEEKISNNHPGYSNFLSQIKKYLFSKKIDKMLESKPDNILDEILGLFFLVIRYPNRIKEYIDKSSNKEKLEEVFNKIYQCLLNNGIFKTKSYFSVTHKTKKASNEVYEILKEFIDDFENLSYIIIKDNQSIANQIKKIENEVSSLSESDDINEYKKELEEAIKNSEKEFESKSITPPTSKQITRVSFPITKGNVILKSKKNYDKIYNEIKKYIYLFRNCILLNDYKENIEAIKDQRKGILDTNKLAQAYQGIDTIYESKILRKYKNEESKYTLCIILDESGSMFTLHDYCTKIAILLFEAMSLHKNINICIYGHGDTVKCYYDGKELKNKYVLGLRELQGDQNEEKSYKIILDDVHSKTKLPVMVISLTDTMYCGDIQEFPKVIEPYKKKGDIFHLFCVNETGILDVTKYNDFKETSKINDEIYGKSNWGIIYKEKDLTDVSKLFSSFIKKDYIKITKIRR